MRDYPKGVIRIYDNGGRSIDRYVVYFSPKLFVANYKMHACLAMNDRPFHPQGFGQHSEGQLGSHNGKVINFEDLPDDCRKLVRQDLAS